MLTRPRSERNGERGSVVVAISVLMLLLLIGTTLIARSQSELGAVVANADAEAAQAGAEQGVAEVLARLEAGETGSFSGDGEVGEGKYAYKAEQVSDIEYFIRAEGYVGGRTRAVEVTVGGSSRSPYSLFVNHKASFADNGGSITGRVGTNGPLVVSGTAPGDAVDFYGPEAQCDRCRVANLFDERFERLEPVTPIDKTQACPSDGVFTGVVDGESGVAYVCSAATLRTDTVQFVDTVTVANPPLIIYVTEGLDVSISNASVNSDGEPADFQLSAQGDRSIYWRFNIWNSKVHGELYAPNRQWAVGQASIYGSIVAGVLEIQSPNDVWITPFETATTASGWTVTSWEEVAAS